MGTTHYATEGIKQRIIDSLTPQGQKNMVAAFVAQTLMITRIHAPESANYIRDMIEKDDFHSLLQFAAHSEMMKEILFGHTFDPNAYERADQDIKS